MVEYKINQITVPIKDAIIESHGYKGALRSMVDCNILYEVENTKSGTVQLYSINCRSFNSIGNSTKIEDWEEYKKNTIEQYNPKKILENLIEEKEKTRISNEEHIQRRSELWRKEDEERKAKKELCAKEGHDLEIKEGEKSWRQRGVYLHDQYVRCLRCKQIMQNPRWNKTEEEKKQKIEKLLEELERKEGDVRKLGIQQQEIQKIKVLLEELRGKEVDKRKPMIQQQEIKEIEVLTTEMKRKLVGTIKRADGTIKEVWTED